ncbi:MAG: hypothetical protein O7G86_07675, partial [Gammaproteobacteria bacterium]|nr:hypothetical protein [Gammaproteobacteria bacterium]
MSVKSFWGNFLGQAPQWYKLVVFTFLVINPLMFALDPFAAGWLLVLE